MCLVVREVPYAEAIDDSVVMSATRALRQCQKHLISLERISETLDPLPYTPDAAEGMHSQSECRDEVMDVPRNELEQRANTKV